MRVTNREVEGKEQETKQLDGEEITKGSLYYEIAKTVQRQRIPFVWIGHFGDLDQIF